MPTIVVSLVLVAQRVDVTHIQSSSTEFDVFYDVIASYISVAINFAPALLGWIPSGK